MPRRTIAATTFVLLLAWLTLPTYGQPGVTASIFRVFLPIVERQIEPTAMATATPQPTEASVPTSTAQPTETPQPTRTPVPPPQQNCHPSYPDFCIPPPPPDLDCRDIGRKRFRVLPPDPHRLDADKDGIGCET